MTYRLTLIWSLSLLLLSCTRFETPQKMESESSQSNSTCTATVPSCPNHPNVQGSFPEYAPESHTDPNMCRHRAQMLYDMCGSTQPVTTEFKVDNKVTQKTVYPNTRCEIEVRDCPTDSSWVGRKDDFYEPSHTNAEICMGRAQQWYEWCGSAEPVTAIFKGNDSEAQTQNYPLSEDEMKTKPWSMGFYSESFVSRASPISELDFDALTHIGHAVASILPDGRINMNGEYGNVEHNADELVRTAHEHNVKVLLLLGIFDWGTSRSGSNLVNAIKADGASVVAERILETIDRYQYDGVDLDWELSFNTRTDWPLVNDFLKAMREKLGPDRLLTYEGGGDPHLWANSDALKALDRLNVMTYDQRWNAPYSWHNSALFSSNREEDSMALTLQHFLNWGVPASKLNLGIPFYAWVSQGEGITGPRIKVNAGRYPKQDQVAYNDLLAQYGPFDMSNPNYHWDDIAQVPWLSTPNGYITFDDERSIAAKAKYMSDRRVGGWIIWEINSDYVEGNAIKHPLLNAIKSVWLGKRLSQ